MNTHAPVVLDISGTVHSAADRKRLKHPLTGGLILFARNWENRQQLIELTASVKKRGFRRRRRKPRSRIRHSR